MFFARANFLIWCCALSLMILSSGAKTPVSARPQVEFFNTTPGHEGEKFTSILYKISPDYPPGSDEQLARAFTEAVKQKSASALLVNFGSSNFEARLASSENGERERCNQHIEHLSVVLKQLPQDETTIIVKAILGHCYYCIEKLELAELTFNQCLKQLKALNRQNRLPFQPLPAERRLYGESINRCRIALGFIYCKRKKFASADHVYADFMHSFKFQSPINLYPTPRLMYLERDGNYGQSINALLATIAGGYASTGHPLLASFKYKELVKNMDLSNSQGGTSVLEAIGQRAFINSGLSLCTDEEHDPIVGRLISSADMQKAYSEFAKNNKSLCDARTVDRVSTYYDLQKQLSMALANRDSRTAEHSNESVQLNLLKTEPVLAVKGMHALIAKRKTDSPNKEFIFDTLMLFSRQLTYWGDYSSAESFAREGLDWLTVQRDVSLLNNQECCTTLAEILLEQGRLHEAETAIVKSINIDGTRKVVDFCSVRTHIVYGKILASKNLESESEHEFLIAINNLDSLDGQQVQSDLPSLNAVASSAAGLSQSFAFQQIHAKRLSDMVARRTSLVSRLRCQIALGSLYLQIGNFDKATVALKAALGLSLEDEILKSGYSYETLQPVVHEHLACLAMCQADYKSALAQLRLAEKMAREQKAPEPVMSSICASYRKLNAQFSPTKAR